MTGSRALALLAAADPSAVGDLTGNLPWTVYLLIPTLLVLAFATAFALGARTEPPAVHRREGRVMRGLEDREARDRREAPEADAPPA